MAVFKFFKIAYDCFLILMLVQTHELLLTIFILHNIGVLRSSQQYGIAVIIEATKTKLQYDVLNNNRNEIVF